MSNIKKNIINRILKIILIIIIFLCIALTNGKNRNVTAPEYVLSTIISLPQRLFNYLAKVISNDQPFFADVNELKEENENLKKEIKKLNQELVEYDLIKEENKNYKIAMQTHNNYNEYEVVIADVIADSANNLDEIFVINKGSKDGIKPEQTVITKDGLVGYIKNVFPDTATIVAIIDASSSFSGRLKSSRDKVIIKGSYDLKDNEMLKVVDIPSGVKINSGDIVETSGMGGLYPKGITVGKILEFHEKDNPLENEAIISSSVDFNKLETVAVILKTVES